MSGVRKGEYGRNTGTDTHRNVLICSKRAPRGQNLPRRWLSLINSTLTDPTTVAFLFLNHLLAVVMEQTSTVGPACCIWLLLPAASFLALLLLDFDVLSLGLSSHSSGPAILNGVSSPIRPFFFAFLAPSLLSDLSAGSFFASSELSLSSSSGVALQKGRRSLSLFNFNSSLLRVFFTWRSQVRFPK